MKRCFQSEGTLPWRMIAAVRSGIMEVPVSPAARIILHNSLLHIKFSQCLPDSPEGPGALPTFI